MKYFGGFWIDSYILERMLFILAFRAHSKSMCNTNLRNSFEVICAIQFGCVCC